MPSDVVIVLTTLMPLGSGRSNGMLCSALVTPAPLADGDGPVDVHVGVDGGCVFGGAELDPPLLPLHDAALAPNAAAATTASTPRTIRR
jgi:hypothetical protein